MSKILLQQIIDSGTIGETINTLSNDVKSNSKLLFVLGGLLLTDIILTGIRIYFDFSLKRMEKTIFSANLKEERRLNVQEVVYGQLDQLSYLEPRDGNTIIDKVTILERYLSSNFLYISKEIATTAYSVCDYYKSVSTDFRKKDIKTEQQLMKKYKEQFNK